jgi:hypothetical protein
VVLKAVKVGDNLTEVQHRRARDLITAYANCFTLSVQEVVPAKDATLHLSIPHEVQLPTKAC